jgi:hypothetical protein
MKLDEYFFNFSARMAEIREEILKSQRLDAYFAKNPRERSALEQDKKQFKLNVYSAGIADVPDYLGKTLTIQYIYICETNSSAEDIERYGFW